MVQSAGVPQLSDNQAPPGRPSSATETEVNLMHNNQAPPPPKESGPNKRRKARVRGNSTRPKKRMTDSRGVSDRPLVEKQGGCDEGSPLPPPLRISLKSLLAAEMKLVYGDEQHNITQQPSKSPVTSSASQFMCQASEIVGPPSGPNLGFLPQIDKWLDVALQDADSYYQQKKYGIAASRFTTALELCSKGAAVEQSLHAVYEDISKVASLIESRLVACYLRLKRPKIALNHSHRAIQLNPIYFRHHLRQAMVYRLLGNPCAAARSAMIADWVYWLSGGSDEHISKLIKLYWQALLDEAIIMEDGFSVMYTPCSAGDSVGDCIAKAEETFRKQNPAFTDYLFTDPSGGHLLPKTTDWSNPPSTQQKYVLTLGFRRGQDGSFLSKLTSRTCPSFTGPRASFSSSSPEDMERVCDTFSRRILPALDFIKCTKLAVGIRLHALSGGKQSNHNLRDGSSINRRLGSSVKRRLGSSAKRRLGSSAKRRLGSSAKRRLGSSAKRRLGSRAKRRLGSSAKRRLGSRAKRRLGSSAKRRLGSTAKRRLGSSAKRRLGSSAKRRLGSSAKRRLGSSVKRRLGSSVKRRLGSSVTRRLGSSVTRRLGSSVTRRLGSTGKSLFKQRLFRCITVYVNVRLQPFEKCVISDQQGRVKREKGVWFTSFIFPMFPCFSHAVFVPRQQAGFSPGSGLVERLQYAGYLGQIQRSREQSVILHQALAELAVAPYLQDLSHAETTLLQALMADTMDTLEGRRTDRERVWNEMQKVGMLEDLLFQLEETYLKNKAQRASRKQRAGVQGAEGKSRGRPKAGVKIEAKGGGTVVTDKAKVRPTETQQETAVAQMTLPDP
ncbi:spermatogenesis-associated protein 16 [Oncorhynchus kisutch]|uniref:spermatogenesis-associated protein 16 n=1 Tax=Oncorhynchus kisutch TaxID=8019 RepID=UPI0012DCDE7E|nr:spermatogenesis-associated protein 16 [Oncorhynchus kisutch]